MTDVATVEAAGICDQKQKVIVDEINDATADGNARAPIELVDESGAARGSANAISADHRASIEVVAQSDDLSGTEALLQHLQQKLETLSGQMKSLQDLPRQISFLVASVGDLEAVTGESLTNTQKIKDRVCGPEGDRRFSLERVAEASTSLEKEAISSSSSASTAHGPHPVTFHNVPSATFHSSPSTFHHAPTLTTLGASRSRKSSIVGNPHAGIPMRMMAPFSAMHSRRSSTTSDASTIIDHGGGHGRHSFTSRASITADVQAQMQDWNLYMQSISTNKDGAKPLENSASSKPPDSSVSKGSEDGPAGPWNPLPPLIDKSKTNPLDIKRISTGSSASEMTGVSTAGSSRHERPKGTNESSQYSSVASIGAGIRIRKIFPSLEPPSRSTEANSSKPRNGLGYSLTRTSAFSALIAPADRMLWTLAQNSAPRLFWDAISIVITILTGLTIPMYLIYLDHSLSDEEVTSAYSHVGPLLWSMDAFWLMDIIFNFFTGFFWHGEMVHHIGLVARHYAQGWLVPDLLAACPLALMTDTGPIYDVACILKLFRVVQLGVRFSRLWSEFIGMKLRPCFTVVMVALLTHLVACLWRLSLRVDGTPLDSGETVFTRYVTDTYFVTMTLTSVGYGDVLPLGNTSRICSIAVMLLGALVFGAIISGVSIFAQKHLNNEAENRISELCRFMKRRSVPMYLQRRVQHNLRQHLTYSQAAVMAPHLLASLSPAMQRELCLSILSNTLLQFPLFRNAQRSFVAELAQVHCWEQVLPGDLVTDEGQAVLEAVFVIEGCLQIWAVRGAQLDSHVGPETSRSAAGAPGHSHSGHGSAHLHYMGKISSNANKGKNAMKNRSGTGYSTQEEEEEMTEIKAGAWFGEASLFDQERAYRTSITAVTKCEMALLPAQQYLAILQRYPTLQDRHDTLQLAIQRGDVSLEDLAFREEYLKAPEPADKPSGRYTSISAFMDSVLPGRMSVVPEDGENRQSHVSVVPSDRTSTFRAGEVLE